MIHLPSILYSMLWAVSLGLLVGCDTASGANPAEGLEFEEVTVYESASDGYHTYRIPALIATPHGSLLAFCEGRKKSRSDAGNIDLVLKRSDDGGRSWGPLHTIWDDGPHTCGNPCPVVDQESGTLWLLMTWNDGSIAEQHILPGWGEDSRRIYISSSVDDGRTWTTPREITRQVKPEQWSWYATGPGAGIQLKRGKYAGRLVIPCDHNLVQRGETRRYSHVIYSDDHGQNWQIGGTSPGDQTNECEVVELGDGRLLLNMRNYDRSVAARQVCLSYDGGETWEGQRHDPILIEPVCQASVRRYRWPDGDKPGVILFSNPANAEKRCMLTVRASFDDCESWSTSRVLHEGASAYSCLCRLPDGSIGCLYEKDEYVKLALARFNLAWLEAGPPATGD